MILKRVFTSLLILCIHAALLWPQSWPQASPVLGENAPEFGFIGYLFSRGEYRAASLELHRYLYYLPGHPSSFYARYVLALCRANLGETGRAEAELRTLARDLERGGGFSKLRSEVLVQTMNMQLRGERFDDLLLLYEALEIQARPLAQRLAVYADALVLAALISDGRWEQARARLRKSRALEGRICASLEQELNLLLASEKKSPLLAGLLSVMPGLGHLYTGRSADGFRSLAVNAAFAGLAGMAFLQGAVLPALLLGTAEIFLYVSNIYGGINAALQVNAARTLDARERMLRLLPVPPLDVITVHKELENL